MIEDSFILSVRPWEIPAFVESLKSAVVVFNPSKDLIQQKGKRIFLHTLGHSDHLEVRRAEEETIKAFGLEVMDIDANALYGWLRVKEIKPYTSEEQFAADNELHNCGESMMLHCAQKNMMGQQPWGIIFDRIVTLEYPILDVFANSGIEEGDIWQPIEMMQIEALKLVKSAEVEEEPEEENIKND